MRKPINVSIEKFVEHQTAKWQGIVFMANDRRYVASRVLCRELTEDREAALDTIEEIDDFPKFVKDMSETFASNPMIPCVPIELITQLNALISAR